MDPVNWALLLGVAVLALVLGGVVTWLLMRRRRTGHLRRRFGPEYDRTAAETGERARAEEELERRERRVSEMQIRPLPEADRTRYAAEWRSVQARFVDEPEEAVAAADRLVEDVMRHRGYPMGDFERQAADLSVDHGVVVQNYRLAHEIAGRAGKGNATTEELRQAMVHYRALFEDLLEQKVTNRDDGTPRRAEMKR